jgi:mitogen-activated protein kinase organizer 1
MRKGEIRCDQMGLPVTGLSLSNDGHIFLVSCLPDVLRLIDKDDGTMYKEYTGHTNKEYQLDNTFSRDDAYVISGSENGSIYIWSLEDGNVVHILDAHLKTVSGLDYHPERPILASSSEDKTVKIWAAPGVVPE